MIYDCFSFFNELELLDIRLHELNNVVDKFILVEATRTHSGLPKPLYFEDNKHLFQEFSDRILHIIVQDMPTTDLEVENALSSQDRHWLQSNYQLGADWVRERFQRNAMMRGLEQCSPEDIIIISDADEIVRSDVIATIEATMCEGSNAVEQTLHTYFLNFKCTNMPWWGSKIIKRKYLTGVTTPSEVRFHTPAGCYIYGGGWHFGFLGGAERVKEKIIAYAHQEFNMPEILDMIGWRLLNKEDALGRQYRYDIVPIDETYPKHIQNNLDKFDHLIYRGINE